MGDNVSDVCDDSRILRLLTKNDQRSSGSHSIQSSVRNRSVRDEVLWITPVGLRKSFKLRVCGGKKKGLWSLPDSAWRRKRRFNVSVIQKYFSIAKVVHSKLVYWQLASKLGKCFPVDKVLHNYTSLQFCIYCRNISDCCLDQKLVLFRTGCWNTSVANLSWHGGFLLPGDASTPWWMSTETEKHFCFPKLAVSD